jgi:lysophospholipase L1-like esterase
VSSSDGSRFRRYVALGDSSAEGLDDPDGHGSYRGWADRLASQIASANGELLYANLAIRGRRTRRIREEQLPPALEMRPDLAVVFSGVNDVVAGSFDLASLAADVEAMQRSLVEVGASVLTFTMPKLDRVLPFARQLAPRLRELNRALREVAAATGATLVDFEHHPVTADPRLWSADRFHANSAGHARIAAAMAHALGLPGTDASWSEPLPPTAAPGRLRRLLDDAGWARRFLLPWLWRHARSRSSGDGRGPKMPLLVPWPAAAPLQALSSERRSQ